MLSDLTSLEREFVSMLNENYDLARFLLCSPHSTDPILNYGGLLSQKEKKNAFMNQLYVEGNKQTEDDIMKDILSGGKSTIKIIGNKGCGKTTLIHKLYQTLACSDNSRTMILDFGESRSTLKFEQAKVIAAAKVYEHFKNDCIENNSACLIKLIELYPKIEDYIDVNWDANNLIEGTIAALTSVISNNKADKSRLLKTDVKHKLYEMELFQVILLFVLFDMFRNPQNKRTTIFLDNLDNMVNIKDIKQSLTHYNNFVNGIGKLFARISHIQGCEYAYRYVFVFVLRDTTNAYLSNHELAIKQIAFSEYDVSNHYSKQEIGIKRINIFTKYVQKATNISEDLRHHLLTTVELLTSILKDPYVTDTIFDIFNNDYRICLMTMIKIAQSEILSNKEYIEIRKNGYAHGSRGVIYRLLFNSFNQSGYFQRIRILDFKNRGINSSSPSRLILTYIANCTDTRLTHDSRVVSFGDLLDDIDEKIPDHDVVRCLWEMYNLVTAEDWCNLISFAESNDTSEEGLINELNYYLAIKNNKKVDKKLNYSTFRITASGLTFLTYACIHFEYFACRAFDAKYPPLFLAKVLEEQDGEYVYKTIVSEVLNEVRICAKKLSASYESQNNLCGNPDSLFVFKRPGKSSQYHVERMIFSHIQYLDEFRRFVLIKNDSHTGKEVSDFVLQIIEQYLKLFEDDCVKCSKYGKEKVFPLLLRLLREAQNEPYNPHRIIGRE